MYCSHFTLGILPIIYVISEENKLLPLYPPHLKNVTALPCKMHIFIWLKVCAFLQTLVAVIKAGCGLALVALKRTGCDVRQMECQASNITTNVQSDHLPHGYMLPVFFATDQLHQNMLCCNSAHVATRRCRSATRPYSELVLDTRERMKKMKILCNFYKVLGRHLGSKSLFLWDNENNLKYEWIILLKNDFLDFPR